MKNANKMSNNEGTRKPDLEKRPDYNKIRNNNKLAYNAGTKNSNGNQGTFDRGSRFQNRKLGKPVLEARTIVPCAEKLTTEQCKAAQTWWMEAARSSR